jgi:hypothetical protein
MTPAMSKSEEESLQIEHSNRVRRYLKMSGNRAFDLRPQLQLATWRTRACISFSSSGTLPPSQGIRRQRKVPFSMSSVSLRRSVKSPSVCSMRSRTVSARGSAVACGQVACALSRMLSRIQLARALSSRVPVASDSIVSIASSCVVSNLQPFNAMKRPSARNAVRLLPSING